MTCNFGRTVLILLAGSALTACATANDFAFTPTVPIPPPAQPAAPQSRATVNGRPVSAPLAIEEPQAEGEDLEIPSFLRRLAN